MLVRLRDSRRSEGGELLVERWDQQESDKAAVVEALRRSLAAGGDISAELRACFYRNPMFSGTLFSEALRGRFGGQQTNEVSRFVARMRANWPQAGPGFPYREAEAVMLGVLGEVSLLDYVDPADFSYPEIGIAVLGRLFAEWQPGPDTVDALFAKVERVRDDAMKLNPGLVQGEQSWFAAGMHRSPFAVPITVPPACRDERAKDDRVVGCCADLGADARGQSSSTATSSLAMITAPASRSGPGSVLSTPPEAANPARPRTKVGLWLRAVVLGPNSDIESLGRQLNNGRPGWNTDEPAVVEGACRLAMREVFASGHDRRDITAFAAMLSEIPLEPGSVVPTHLEIEAVIRHALGDTTAIIGDIKPSKLLTIRDWLVLVARHKQSWSEAEVNQLIAQAELLAFERGLHPPLAPTPGG